MTALEPIGRLAGLPADVADAVDRVAHIAAMKAWLVDVEQPVRDWLNVKADEIEKATGGAFNVPVAGVGRALRTDPPPKPVVTDHEALGRWIVARHGHDPDEWEPALENGAVDRRDVATVDSAHLLTFLARFAAAGDDPGEVASAAVTLAGAVTVEETWYVDPGYLDVFKVAGDRLVDRDTGEVVPGVEVRRGQRTLTVTPDKRRKAELIQQLERMLAPNDRELM